MIQALLAEAGITMTIQTQENVTMLAAGRKGDFEAYFTFWSGRPDPDGNVFAFTTCNGGQNDSKYCNADLDAILTKARHEADPAERKKLYDQTTEILLRDLPRLVCGIAGSSPASAVGSRVSRPIRTASSGSRV